MKLRYKKAILFVLICTMGIGIVTLSIAPTHNAAESIKYDNPKEGEEASDITEVAVTVTPAAQPITMTPLPTPTPAPLPVYDLEEDGHPEITKFFKSYYKAKLDCDKSALKKMLSDTEGMPTEDQLKEAVQFIEEYQKIKCYVKKGYLEGTYIIFVTYEIKYFNIDTSAPGAKMFYLITEEDGSLKIFSGVFDDETKEYYYARKQDADVQKLIEATNKKGEEAKAKDETLKTFWEGLEKIQASSESDTKGNSADSLE